MTAGQQRTVAGHGTSARWVSSTYYNTGIPEGGLKPLGGMSLAHLSSLTSSSLPLLSSRLTIPSHEIPFPTFYFCSPVSPIRLLRPGLCVVFVFLTSFFTLHIGEGSASVA